ncbi:DUF2057 family protein [Shewanella gelidii]|uniref:DUF2057 domain-containing protein n=1 Tax=Shewanella gelidii TaxID=1642821 RepID=A0A917JUH7_9GAMM|nr:DUF2057 family protein [Shewanella gelidii]MCL1098536.1 DUF2057 domain-containing protein [Shewanella gelidii]GGI81968.1 hypothetical protein GCM10009332_19020 [Shewanella gelidii]
MKNLTLLSALVASTLALGSSITHAASVSLPESLEIRSLNGQAVTGVSQIQLSEGEHLLELQYDDLFESNADDTGARVTSQALYLPIELQDSQAYRLVTANINSEEDARAFVDAPVVYLLDTQGNRRQIDLVTQKQLMLQVILGH